MTNPKWIEQWQTPYDLAVGKGGKVQDVFARIGPSGGIAIFVEVYEPEKGVLYYSPYLNSMPGDDHTEDPDDDPCTCTACAFELDPDAWLDGMMGATNWGEWDWDVGMKSIPGY
ncbi:hypothetical protein LCGC14_1484970 [marine sediment metagenome]|uniref:Uncharacterized protein n=1 Tax=marine sediment metagenome TaxID=412755 RepID=A0A0F9MA97_9ZZZZ